MNKGGFSVKHRINGKRNNVIKTIDNCIVGFKSQRNREILKDHFADGLTFEEVAEKHSMSVRQVKQICYNNEPIINKHMHDPA